ncbi:hypothetical protein WOLCODRAFT_138128 [Wolfiporia cocos MD-104 SS10]|uniref:BTB domain-containing protein n=1 Tax=Wolfiporia cocos (strain MD-104) TaxID=742152 RepID=A0A2H3JYK5_WOLCO|nr:hypothetical protein WOLCODRAFT_138128 [Wolfiporia cocos MD-104 SS10]
MDETEDLLSFPPLKRQRYDSQTRSHPTASSSFFFHDGDIVLEVEQHLFKIHKHRLKCSVIFSDMLDIPQPDVIDSMHGCPVVRLMDSPQDWQVALRWIYDPTGFRLIPEPVPFPLIPSALRIATKYEIGALRKWAVGQLRARWPSDLERMGSSSLPCAAEAIALARECDVLEILPAAFYALSLQRWCYNAEGGRSHLVLSPTDIRRLIVGRERLSDVCKQILFEPLVSRPAGLPFDACHQCREPLQRYWREKVMSDPQSPVECWLLRELYTIATQRDELFESAICAQCLAWHKDVAWMRFYGLKASIPQFFCL